MQFYYFLGEYDDDQLKAEQSDSLEQSDSPIVSILWVLYTT